ncbi:MAG: isoprenylcysteine carboxylmethyltransferase family protein [Fibrobacteres bacterium]|nr:isoprenylcysteine carboxylmethyltransferase family protein [Fibrobacterota bacterium]
MAALLGALALARYRSHAPLQPAWLALLAAGLGWRAWAGAHIDGHSNGAVLSGPSLAAGGPYRISRHPLYFANLLCAAGIVLYAHCLPLWAAVLGIAVAVAHHEALARAEEKFLLARHGEIYRRYMQVTPRWPGMAMRKEGQGAPGQADGGGSGPGEADRGRDAPAKAEVWRPLMARQGWNLAKGCACALIIRIAAAASG